MYNKRTAYQVCRQKMLQNLQIGEIIYFYEIFLKIFLKLANIT